MVNKVLAIIAEKAGEIIHDKIIPETPPTYGNKSVSSYQLTHLTPFNAIVIPIIPPTQECVVETGISYLDAINNHIKTDKQTHIQPYIKGPGSLSKHS